MEFVTAFGPKVACDFECTGESMTHQEFKDECDINFLMKRYMKTGVLDHVNKYQGQYGDFIGAESYLEARLKIQEANEAFETLPSDLRYQFANDPAQFLDFVQNPDNVDKLVEMGLATKQDGVVNPSPAPVVDNNPPVAE